ncbi:MAG: flippase-like domain-containing protein [bacterium]|nr:flippase-like domain-containing protein [bacterium]
MNKKVLRISAIIGLLIFAFILYKIGLYQIWENIRKITPLNFAILMGMRLLYWLLRTICWKVVLDQYGEKISLFQMFVARMSCHSVSQLTPSAAVGGEAARVFMVNSSSRKISLASVILDKTIEFITVIFFTIIGVTVIIMRIPLPPKIKTIFIGVVALASLLLFFLLRKQTKGMFEWGLDLLIKLKLKFKVLERNREKIRETDELIADFYRKYPATFIRVFLLYSLLILLWAAEIHLTLIFIGADNITYLDSFLITVLGNLAFVFPLIPGSLGIYEATYVALFAVMKKGTGLGFTLVLIRRTLALLWAGIGLVGMLKSSPRENRHKPE